MQENKSYIYKCGLCGGKIALAKPEKMKVYHGDCWVKLKKQIGEKSD